MNSTIVSCLVVLGLILVEALFVASEIALISLRESQLHAMAASGRRGAIAARLVSDPNRFLATVQIGVTLTSLLSSAYGATTLSGVARRALVRLGMDGDLAGFIGLVGVTMVISFVTLVIGELAPKRLALQRAESTAKVVAPFLQGMSRLTRPVIWLLSVCTDGVVRLFGGDPAAAREKVSEEELRRLVASTETLSSDERRIIDDVFGVGDRQLREVFVPRTEVVFLDGAMSPQAAAELISGLPHSRYPVTGGSADNVLGFVHVRDLLDRPDSGADGVPGADGARPATVAELARPVMFLPGTKQVLAALSEMRRESFHLSIVVDEYGGTAGIVTLEDLLEELIGEISDEYDEARSRVTRLRDGDLVLDGLINLEDFYEETGVALADGPYETLAGYMVARLGRVAAVGDHVELDGGARLTVVAMEGRRIARVRMSHGRVPGQQSDAAPTPEPAPAPEPALASEAVAEPAQEPAQQRVQEQALGVPQPTAQTANQHSQVGTAVREQASKA
ncbi:MAG TPA: hemolysin family protein [Actinocrinis sp.]